jgi:Leucine-rich repeat (LRR) protein
MRYWDDRVERRINLSACNIRRVHPAALLPVRRLRSISVSGNPHLAVEDVRAAIRNNESSVTRYLETFEFEWNSAFRSFGDPSELFSEPAAVHLDHVTELGLAGNRIRSIPTGAFHAFLTPSSTNASQNVTPNGAIRSIVGLRRLDLSWNYLTSIDAGLAEMGDTLERLSLTGNRIANLDDDDDDDNNNRSGLQRFQRLLELDLAHNELNRLTGNVLRRGPFELRRLNVGYNRIRLIGDESLPLGLEFFIAPGNRLTDVGFLRRLPRLRVVDVSDNAIVRLGGDVFASVVFGFPPTHRQHKPVAAAAAEHDNGDGTTARRHPPTATPVVSANFSRNEISYVEPDAFRLVAFDVLDLSENRLTHVSPFGWHFVDILLLDGNQLSSVEADVFLEGDGPRELYVRRNRLQSLAFPGSMRNRSNGFESAVSRTMLLDVSDNPEIGNFLERPNGAVADPPPPGVFDLRRLEVLRAERTNLRRLPTEFTNRLRSLRVLDVSGNQLEDVNGRPRQLETDRQDAAFGALAHLHEIDISRNRLTQFPVELLRGDGSELRVVHLADNPWRCNCSSLALCRLQTIERLVRSDADDEHDDDVTDRTRCNFASFGGDPVVSVSVSLVDLCRVDSAFRSRCSASSAFGTALAAGDIVIYRGTTVSWKLVLGVVAALTGLTVFPLAALVVWHFGVTASGRRRQMRRCRRDMVSGGIRRAKSGGYHVVDETALNGADHEDTDCTQPL